jgi:hypothetical protein
MEHLNVEDAARIMAVPANLLGAQIARTRPDLEQDLMTWLRFGLGPELQRIEDALYADPDLFGGSQTYPAFDTEGFVRGDILTEQTVLQSRVQSGILTPDEARAILGYDALPDGVGAIPQITPVGGAPNALPMPLPKKPQDAETSPDAFTKSVEIPSIELRLTQDLTPVGDAIDRHLERVDEATERLAGHVFEMGKRGRELEASREARAIRQAEEVRAITSGALGAIEAAQQPEIHLHVGPTPVEVHNHVPQQSAPEVHIHEAPAEQMLEIEFDRDGYGLIKSATTKKKD